MAGLVRRLRRGRSFSADEVIDALYQGLLDRPAEPTGASFQAARLEEGLPLTEMVHGIGHSREYFEKWLRGGDLPAVTEQLWASAEMHPGEPQIFLLHIMKTGGTALVDGLTAIADGRFCLHQVFLDHLVAMPEVVLERAALVAGHLGTEALDYLPADVVTATVIRNPVERVLSHFAHVRRDPALAGETGQLGLEEFIHSPRWAPYVANFQAASLVQRVGLRRVWRERPATSLLDDLPPERRPRDPELPIQAAFELLPTGLGAQELTGRALAELAQLRHVGTSDNLQGLFEELARYWSVADPPGLPRSNVGANRLALTDVPETLVREISDANGADWALYDQARSRARASAPSPRASSSDAVAPPPAPRREAPRPPRREGARTGGTLVLATLAIAAVALLDTFFVHGIALMSLVVIGPCIAMLGRRWKPVAASGAMALAAAVVLARRDGVWWTSDQLAVLTVVALISVFGTVSAHVAETGRSAPWMLRAENTRT